MIKIELIRRDLIGKKLLFTVKTISPGTDIDKHGNCGHMPNSTELNPFNHGSIGEASLVDHLEPQRILKDKKTGQYHQFNKTIINFKLINSSHN